MRSFVAGDQSLGMASVMTVQLQGLVSGDESGPVSVANPPDLTRFKQVVDKKSTINPAAFTETPPTSDSNVYMDEFLWTMDQKIPGIFGDIAPLPTFVSLDNEPELWNSTHLEVQGSQPNLVGQLHRKDHHPHQSLERSVSQRNDFRAGALRI